MTNNDNIQQPVALKVSKNYFEIIAKLISFVAGLIAIVIGLVGIFPILDPINIVSFKGDDTANFEFDSKQGTVNIELEKQKSWGSVILLVLGLSTELNLLLSLTTKKLQISQKEIENNVIDINKKTSQIDQIALSLQNMDSLYPSFDKKKEEIHQEIEQAKALWLLSNSGYAWYNDFKGNNDEPLKGFLFQQNISSKDNRLMFLDPRPKKGALNMQFKSDQKKQDIYENDYSQYQSAIRQFYCTLLKEHRNKFQLKVINYLTPFTIILVNPSSNDDNRIMYVEFAQYYSDSKNRQVGTFTTNKEIDLKLGIDQNNNYKDLNVFEKFIFQFNNIWLAATYWTLLETIELETIEPSPNYSEIRDLIVNLNKVGISNKINVSKLISDQSWIFTDNNQDNREYLISKHADPDKYYIHNWQPIISILYKEYQLDSYSGEQQKTKIKEILKNNQIILGKDIDVLTINNNVLQWRLTDKENGMNYYFLKEDKENQIFLNVYPEIIMI